MKYVITLLVLSTIACAVSSAPAVVAPTGYAQAVQSTPTAQATANTVTALGRVNVRECPATDCDVLGFVEFGAELSTAGDVVGSSSIDCPRWQPVAWRGETAYVCAGWVSR